MGPDKRYRFDPEAIKLIFQIYDFPSRKILYLTEKLPIVQKDNYYGIIGSINLSQEERRSL